MSAAYVAWHLNRGWVPLDEGSLAHPAQRVLFGELPHRDFDDVYTGGLAYLNAAAFRVFGTTLWAMRLVLLGVLLAWVPAVYYVASRFARPLMAAGITLLALAWSVPNYPAPMPSWYNLFLATFGIAALLRFLEDGRRRWLVAAGAAGALSFLVKVIGLYYVAGVLLFLVFHARELSREHAAPEEPAAGRGYAAFVTGALLLFVAVLAVVVRGRPSIPDLIQFLLPGAAIAAMLVRDEWTRPAGTSAVRTRTLARVLVPFAAGLLVPVALYLVPYALSGALGAFVHGVFVLPTKRLIYVTYAPPPLRTMVALVPVVAMTAAVTWPRKASIRLGGRELALLGAALVAVLIASGSVSEVYRLVLFSFRALVPVMALASVALLTRDDDRRRDATLRRARLMLLLSVTAVCTLVQFPLTLAIYFCYLAPLVVLTAAALLAYLHRPVPAALPAMAVAFCTAFAVLWMNRSPLNDMDTSHEPYPEVRPMRLDRAGVLAPLWQAGQYEAAVDVVRQHARGEYIWASPDAPQFYFLAGYRNPTRSLFEFFDDTTGRSARVLRTLDEHQVNLVVLNVSPQFSPRISMELYRELAKRYPNSAMVEPYLIKWRD